MGYYVNQYDHNYLQTHQRVNHGHRYHTIFVEHV